MGRRGLDRTLCRSDVVGVVVAVVVFVVVIVLFVLVEEGEDAAWTESFVGRLFCCCCYYLWCLHLRY